MDLDLLSRAASKLALDHSPAVRTFTSSKGSLGQPKGNNNLESIKTSIYDSFSLGHGLERCGMSPTGVDHRPGASF